MRGKNNLKQKRITAQGLSLIQTAQQNNNFIKFINQKRAHGITVKDFEGYKTLTDAFSNTDNSTLIGAILWYLETQQIKQDKARSINLAKNCLNQASDLFLSTPQLAVFFNEVINTDDHTCLFDKHQFISEYIDELHRTIDKTYDDRLFYSSESVEYRLARALKIFYGEPNTVHTAEGLLSIRAMIGRALGEHAFVCYPSGLDDDQRDLFARRELANKQRKKEFEKEFCALTRQSFPQLITNFPT